MAALFNCPCVCSRLAVEDTGAENQSKANYSCIRNSPGVIDVMTRHLVSIESNVSLGARAGYLHWGI